MYGLAARRLLILISLYNMLGATGAAKLTRESSTKHERSEDEEWMGYEGDDSNETNIAGLGLQVMRHTLAVVRLEFVE